MKKLLAILMALCILLSLVACNAGQAGGKEVTIRFWQAGGDTVGASTVMRMLLDKFEAANPGIKVEYQAIPWSNDPHVMFQTGIAGGDIADLLVVGSPLDFQLSNEDAVLPLDDLLSDAVKKDISPVLMTECTYTGSENEAMKGKIMSVPLYTGTRAIMYNKEIFDYFKVEYPTKQMTHAELLDMARKLTGDMNGTKIYGYGTRATTSEQYLNFAWNYGAILVDPATWTAGTSSDAWRKGIEDYLKFYTEGLTPEGSVAMDGATLFNMFANGEIAMFCGAVDYAQTLVNEGWTEAKLGIAALPGETYATCYCGADVLVVPNKGKDTQTEAVKKLINFLMGAEAQATYCKVVGFFPGVASAAADPYFSEDFVQAGFAATTAGAHYFGNFGVPGVGTILKANIQMLINGEVTMDQYIQNVTAELQAKIDETYK
jgi:multiple sugar transport system substrate-binding protein